MCSALFAWFALAALLAGIGKTATGKACNECKTNSRLPLSCILSKMHTFALTQMPRCV